MPRKPTGHLSLRSSPHLSHQLCMFCRSTSTSGAESTIGRPVPGDEELCSVLRQVRLGLLLERGGASSSSSSSSDGTSYSDGAAHSGLDHLADWGGILSLGEQQRLAFARQSRWLATSGSCVWQILSRTLPRPYAWLALFAALCDSVRYQSSGRTVNLQNLGS